MQQGPDRKKLRRGYLTKKAANLIGFGTIVPLYAAVLAVAVLCGCFTIFQFAKWISLGCPTDYHAARALTTNLGFTIMLTHGTNKLRQCWLQLKHTYSVLEYIPPITADTLPSAEVLVRGSEEPPVAQSEALLRAAQQGHDTPKEELLRVTGQE